MNTDQEPKYRIEGESLVNRVSGEPIPADEPVFVLRARDRHAVNLLSTYLLWVQSRGGQHAEAVRLRMRQFEHWAAVHPERMKEPDTILTQDWKGYVP